MSEAAAQDDAGWMRRALALAERGVGLVEPNPLVGAVIVREGQTLGEGCHSRFGQAHAERAALADCRRRGEDPAGATLYVNLEPCSHHGKTPPCAQAVIEAGLHRVVSAMEDPNPEVAGRGHARLREAGLAVTVGVEGEAARWLNRGFLRRLATGRPWVIGKWAQTVDGRLATRHGDSQWISGQLSREKVHHWRGLVDAVMVGPGTFTADDPRLTARGHDPPRTARRVVIDPPAGALPGSRLLAAPGPVLLVTDRATRDHIEKSAAETGAAVALLTVERDATGHLALPPVLQYLGQQCEATHVLVEGGGGLTGQLLNKGLLDELRVFLAPRLMGDAQAISAVRGLPPATMPDATRLTLKELARFDDDLLLQYAVKTSSEAQ
jgi:diaminohydroxyphosphoribosylaminopyrimidine deaminase/5-amino-6-(5-phosphoribosylamino)uracil reductase